eukprot:TRINITY_DN6074_c0_g1_i1.p1 TRINITY_DN6074_c0_g1~~TRINITY_DN6074_c0_g1_i1.p1  ORF type:complete len:144 (+),score=42.92 TRINITY_DN6074_c0_g1_i1:33-464(+)
MPNKKKKDTSSSSSSSSIKKEEDDRRTALRVHEWVQDWNGTQYNKLVLGALCVGCIVRVIVGFEKKRGWEKIYFQITKIKDGSVWGIAQDTYRSDDYIGLPSGSSFSFRLDDIIEIPLAWQPTRRIQKELESYLIVTPTPPPT